jgi:pyridoxine 5-phosphate synthase
MTRLSVNINKVATLRNARGGLIPDVIKFAVDCENYGAEGITVHPRPDERHITRDDVYALSEVVSTEFNIEGYPDPRYLQMVKETKPTQATLVPDGPDVLTSNAGWDTVKNQDFLQDIVATLKSCGTRVSIFVDPVESMLEGAARAGADRIELYTEPYARDFLQDPSAAIAPYKAASAIAEKLSLEINAGHDLNRKNLKFFKEEIGNLEEVSIGHALISDALYLGIENTIQLYKRCLR